MVEDPRQKDHINFRLMSMFRDQDFWEDLPPIRKAINGFHRLRMEASLLGRDTFIVSVPDANSPISYMAKCRWVKKHLGAEVVRKLVLTQDKTIVDGAVLIDDSPTVAGDHEPSWRHIMFRSAHNREVIADASGQPIPVMEDWMTSSVLNLIKWI